MDIFVRAAGLSDNSTNEEIINLAADAMDAAADEIERLRKRVELLEGYLNGALNLVENFAHCDTTDARKALGEKE
jgi:hypothetical protein